MSIENYMAYLTHAYQDLVRVGESLKQVNACLLGEATRSELDAISLVVETLQLTTLTSMQTVRERGEYYDHAASKTRWAEFFETTEESRLLA